MRNLLYNILTLFILSVIFVSCSGSNEYEAKIKRAENIMDSNPDTALAILNSIDDSRLSSKQKMHCHLMRTLAQNKADIPFKSDSMMKDVVKYYDSHGTSNEKLTANYLMGRVYADIDNPMVALEFYHKAVEQADTTSDDCDFKTLSRVHGHLAKLFHIQLLPEYELKEEQLAIDYAWKAKDTLAALMFYEHLAGSFYRMNKKDSMIHINQKASELYKKYGYKEKSSTCQIPSIYIYIEQEQYAKSKFLIDNVIQNSGWIDNNGNFKEGHEGCYDFMGMYYEGINKLDSAEYCYRKLMNYANPMSNHEIALKGLMSVYQKRNIPDSVAKYAQMYCEYNDSSYQKLSADKVLRMQAIYDYSHSQHISDIKTIEAKQYKLWAYCASIFILIAAQITYYIFHKQHKKKIERAETYARTMFLYSKTKKDLNLLHNNYKEYKKIKQQEIENLQKTISAYQDNGERPDEWGIEENMIEEDIVQDFHKLAIKGRSVSDSEWTAFVGVINKYNPRFISTITDKKYGLTIREIRTCILIKFKFIPAEIGILLKLSTQQVTNTRSSINKKIFGITGAKTLDNNISKL